MNTPNGKKNQRGYKQCSVCNKIKPTIFIQGIRFCKECEYKSIWICSENKDVFVR